MVAADEFKDKNGVKIELEDKVTWFGNDYIVSGIDLVSEKVYIAIGDYYYWVDRNETKVTSIP